MKARQSGSIRQEYPAGITDPPATELPTNALSAFVPLTYKPDVSAPQKSAPKSSFTGMFRKASKLLGSFSTPSTGLPYSARPNTALSNTYHLLNPNYEPENPYGIAYPSTSRNGDSYPKPDYSARPPPSYHDSATPLVPSSRLCGLGESQRVGAATTGAFTGGTDLTGFTGLTGFTDISQAPNPNDSRLLIEPSSARDTSNRIDSDARSAGVVSNSTGAGQSFHGGLQPIYTPALPQMSSLPALNSARTFRPDTIHSASAPPADVPSLGLGSTAGAFDSRYPSFHTDTQTFTIPEERTPLSPVTDGKMTPAVSFGRGMSVGSSSSGLDSSFSAFRVAAPPEDILERRIRDFAQDNVVVNVVTQSRVNSVLHAINNMERNGEGNVLLHQYECAPNASCMFSSSRKVSQPKFYNSAEENAVILYCFGLLCLAFFVVNYM